MKQKHEIKNINEITLLIIFIISTLSVGFLSPDRFFTFNNLYQLISLQEQLASKILYLQ